MLSEPFKKLLLILVLLALGAALVLQFINSRFKPAAQVAPAKNAKAEFQYHYTPPTPKTSPAVSAEADDEINELDQLKIPRDKAEAWLARHNRNAASLLAVFRALGDTNYLNEAATNFPNDPQVELAVLLHNAFPEDRRKWLNLFKQSSPSNSLANYLSAQALFENGKPDEAVKELLAAAGKSQFQNYAMETQLDAEELYRDSGKSPFEAATYALSSMAEDDLPQMADLKKLDNGIAELMKQKIAGGDTESALNLAQMGFILAGQLNTGDSGKYAINQLVGMATEAIMLSPLEQNTAYDFLDGQTPAQILQQLKQQKMEFRQLIVDFQAIYPTLSEAELNNYYRRFQIYGEISARKWLVQQHLPADSQK